jgi:hypothetical protein
MNGARSVVLLALATMSMLGEAILDAQDVPQQLHSYVGQKLILRSYGNDQVVTVKRTDLNRGKGTCDKAVEVLNVTGDKDKAVFQLEQIGEIQAGGSSVCPRSWAQTKPISLGSAIRLTISPPKIWGQSQDQAEVSLPPGRCFRSVRSSVSRLERSASRTAARLSKLSSAPTDGFTPPESSRGPDMASTSRHCAYFPCGVLNRRVRATNQLRCDYRWSSVSTSIRSVSAGNLECAHRRSFY